MFNVNDDTIKFLDSIVKGGVAIILSIGLLVLFGVNAYIQMQQLDIMRANLDRQTRALEDIARIYSGK